MDFDIYAPFDAVQTGTDQDGKPIYDRVHRAEHLRALQKAIISNGVLPMPSTNLQVLENENMTVTVKPGYIFIEGAIGRISTDKTVTIGAADGVLHRIDAVVARLDYLERKIVIDVVAGTPASSPSAPALTRDEDAYELALAYVRINAGATSIVTANITDKRQDSSVCGIAGNLMTAETDTLFVQFQAAIAALMASAESDLSDAIDGNQTAWDAWFATVQNALDGDTAGNLLNLINAHTADTDNPHSVTSEQIGAAPADHDHDADYAPKAPAQYTLSVPTTGWTGAAAPFTLDIAKTGVAVGQIYDIYLLYSSAVVATMEAEDAAFACISRVDAGANKFTLQANESIPETAITLRAIYRCEEAE